MSVWKRVMEVLGGQTDGPQEKPGPDRKGHSPKEDVAAVLTTAAAEDSLDRQTLTPAEVCRTGPDGNLDGTISETKSPFLVVLDRADAPADLLLQVRAFFLRNPKMGLISSGESSLFSGQRMFQLAARRDALLQVGGWHEDTERELRRLGWGVEDAGLFEDRAPAVPLRAVRLFPKLIREPATLCIALSGREWAWPLLTKFLEEQTYPHETIHLLLLDASQNPAFSSKVRSWISQCNYAGVTHSLERSGPIALADPGSACTADAIRHAKARLYNLIARACRTDLVLLLEEDVIPPNDAYVRLLRHFESDVISVSAMVRNRHDKQRVGKVEAWEWTPEGGPKDLVEKTGVSDVGGNGFGCLVLRGDYLRDTVFGSGPPLYNFDQNFYHRATYIEKRRAILDWDCVCKHYSTASQWV